MSTTTTTTTTTAGATTTSSSSTLVASGTNGDNPPPNSTTTQQTNGHNHRHHHHHHHHKQVGKKDEVSKDGTKTTTDKPIKPKKPKQFKPKSENKEIPRERVKEGGVLSEEGNQQQQQHSNGANNKPKNNNKPKSNNNKKTTTTTTTTTTTSSNNSNVNNANDSNDEELPLSSLINLGKFKNEAITDSPLCIICCDPIVVYARGPCDHIDVCALCILKQRELYKEFKCSICKTENSQVIFTNLDNRKYSEYQLKDLVLSKELNIYFENKEFLENLSTLWEYNCKLCTFKAESLRKLEFHLNTRHHLVFCEICVQDRKVFLYQQNLYDPRELPIHLAEWNGGASKEQKKVKKGHPVCKFCNKYFYGIDQLYEHLNKNHFTCFVCEKMGVQYQYFKDYQKLRFHFDDEHFPCTDPDCLEKKYIVFVDEVSLRSHEISTHLGASKGISKNQKRNMTHIRNLIDFNISSSSSSTNSNVINNNNNSNQYTTTTSSSSQQSRSEQFPAISGSSENILLGITRAPTSFNPDFHLVKSEQQQMAAKQVSQSELEERNKKLMQQISSILSVEKRNEFKARSLDFKNGKIGVNEYYTKFIALFGKDKAETIFDELVALLPDQSKRDELLQIHSFMKHLEQQYPSLGNSSADGSKIPKKNKSQQNHISVWTTGTNADAHLHQVKRKPSNQVLSYNQSIALPSPTVIHVNPTTTTTTTTSSNSYGMASKIQQHSRYQYDDSDSDDDSYPSLPPSSNNNYSKIQVESKPFGSYASSSSSSTSSKPSVLSKKVPSKDDFPSLPGSDKPLPKPQPVVEKKDENKYITKGGKKKQVFYL